MCGRAKGEVAISVIGVLKCELPRLIWFALGELENLEIGELPEIPSNLLYFNGLATLPKFSKITLVVGKFLCLDAPMRARKLPLGPNTPGDRVTGKAPGLLARVFSPVVIPKYLLGLPNIAGELAKTNGWETIFEITGEE